jgi:tetratricopeptide (TPR) repeat protein
MKHLWAIGACAIGLLAMALGSMSALAADSQQSPEVGFVEMRGDAPCMLAKFGHGQPCKLPELAAADTSVALQASARVSRARFYIDTGDKQGALVEAEEALKLTPDDVDVRHLVARLAMSVGDTGRAEREFAIALKQRPGDANIQASSATRLLLVNTEEALGAFNKILSAHPGHRYSLQARAKLLMQLGPAEAAIADLDVLLAGDHRDANLLALRATAGIAAGRPRQAVADLTEALEQFPGRYDLVSARALANEILGDDKAALADYEVLLGPIGGQPNYAISGDQLAKFRMQRAFVSVRLKRFADAAAEAVDALGAGGSRSLLRAQVFLRQNGFPETPLDGQPSERLRKVMQACMGLNSCFEKISGSL